MNKTTNMKLQDVQSNYDNAQKLAKQNYIKDFCRWLKEFYPAAKTFEFDGNWESDDEGGSDLWFSSLTVNDEDFKGILLENKDLAREFFFDRKEYYKDEFEDHLSDEDQISDWFFDTMNGTPEIMYSREYSIEEELKEE